jgi:hypothetical protein
MPVAALRVMPQPDLAKSTATATPQSSVPEPVATKTTEPGFSLDGFLGTSAGKLRKLHFPDLGAVFKQTIASAIDTAAPVPGTEMELEATLRCPIYQGVFMTGTPSIKVSRDESGVKATFAGGMGLSVGSGEVFGDVLATASIQGEGGDSTRAVEMLALAVEQYVRAVPNFVFLPFARKNIPISLLMALADAAGVTVGNFIADTLWGGGHADAVIAGMRDGEAAQITAGGTVGGSFDIPGGKEAIDIGGELVAGVEGTQRTEKKAGAAAETTTSGAMKVEGEVSFAGGTGGVSIDLPFEPKGAGTLTFTGKATGDIKLLGKLEPFVSFIGSGITKAQALLAAAPTELAPGAATVSQTAAAARDAMRTAVLGLSGTVLAGLDELGADVAAGVEVEIELDAAARSGKVTVSGVVEAEQELGLGNEAAVTQKMQLAEGSFKIPR